MPSSRPSDDTLVYRAVHRRIGALMESGELRPGHMLSVVQIGRAFGVSRSSVREALELLEQEGAVTQLARRGYVVTGGRRSRIAAADLAPYAFAPMSISTENAWKHVYKEAEREIATRMLFRSVRVTEQRLSSHFGVSRTVVREALAHLAANGLIGKDPRGRWIAERVTPATLRNLYELRWLLEPAALLDSAPKVPTETIDEVWRRLETTIARFPRVDSADLDRLETDLHGTLLEQCANKPLLRVLDQARPLIITTRYLFNDLTRISIAGARQSAVEHLRVVERLRAGDHGGACAALVDHLHRSLDKWTSRLGDISLVAEPPMPGFLVPAGAPDDDEPSARDDDR